MRKPIAILLILTILVGLFPMTAQAATMDSYAGAVTTSSAPLNVRAKASANSAVVTMLKKGSYVTLLGRSGAWWQVEYGKGQQGYCHSDYITPVEGTPAAVNASALNVRSGAGTSYARVGSLSRGEVVLKLKTSGSWTRILYHGTKTGWVSSQYLSGSNTGGISLGVPSFKQNDSRWANVTLGASGKTIRQIGCATTAIAMMESYRTGTTIYPDAMSKKLSYTSTGSVYWPSHYTTVARYDLNAIHSLLQQGKPVLLGAKNASGGQHWVVITGFTGGSVTAANFTINDPGSNTRTTLQGFLNAYPTIYKYFHY